MLFISGFKLLFLFLVQVYKRLKLVCLFLYALIYIKSMCGPGPSAFVLHAPVVLSEAWGALVQWLRSFGDKNKQIISWL